MANLVACQLVSSPAVQANLDQVETLLTGLQAKAPTLVVLPECFACFGGKDQTQLAIAEAKGQGKIQARLQAMAAKYRVWLVAGTLPLQTQAPDKFTASSLLIDDQGELCAEYQKIHLFDVQIEDSTGAYRESSYTQAGNRLVTLDTPFGRLGMAVCYDVRFAGMFQAMGQLDVLVLPSAFTEKTGQAHWHPLLRARAIEKQCYLVAANQGGIHENGRQTYGHSCIISPWGDLLSEIASGSGLVQARMQPELVQQIRRNMPLNQHNKFRSYLD